MNCLKCGKETTREHIFCDHCLDIMAAYPVKPGTPVHLPRLSATAAGKKPVSRKRTLSQEELILRQKKLLRGLACMVVVLAILLGLTAAALIYTGQALTEAKNTGKNFTVETTPPT